MIREKHRYREQTILFRGVGTPAHLYGCAHMAEEEHQRILKSIGEVLRANMCELSNEPPPRAILLQVLHLVRQEQERRGAQLQPMCWEDLPEDLRRLLEQLRSRKA
jgi:hypothetical protein